MNCAKCTFWQPMFGKREASTHGECRAAPPAIVGELVMRARSGKSDMVSILHDASVWPVCAAEDWCGALKPVA